MSQLIIRDDIKPLCSTIQRIHHSERGALHISASHSNFLPKNIVWKSNGKVQRGKQISDQFYNTKWPKSTVINCIVFTCPGYSILKTGIVPLWSPFQKPDYLSNSSRNIILQWLRRESLQYVHGTLQTH